MILTKAIILLALPLVFATGSPLNEGSEKHLPKSEIMSRIKRLLQVLRQREYESGLDKQTPHSALSSHRARMLERRRKLESLLERNPGLRSLLKSVLEKRKVEEAKMLQSDACRPGLFYCRDSNEKSETREALKEIMSMRKSDPGRYCPPGIFYCHRRPRPSGDDREPGVNEIDHHQRDRLKILDQMFPDEDYQHQQTDHEMRDLDRVMSLSKDQKASSNRKQMQNRKVQFIRVPAALTKIEKSDESAKAKKTEGEKLADDLVKSLHDTGSSKVSETNQKPANHDESNFDLKQLLELLKETKR